MILNSPTDAAQLAQIIERVLTDAALREQLATGARQFARQYAWPGVARAQEETYRQLCAL